MSETTMPSIQILGQFIRHLSVDNPAPFDLLGAEEPQIKTQVHLDVQGRPVGENTFEIALLVKLEIMKDDQKAFGLDMTYTAFAQTDNADETVTPLLVFVRAPQLMLPSVRHLIRSMTMEGSLPPFMMRDIDFMQLLEQKMRESESESTN